jgi:hypothetical protein
MRIRIRIRPSGLVCPPSSVLVAVLSRADPMVGRHGTATDNIITYFKGNHECRPPIFVTALPPCTKSHCSTIEYLILVLLLAALFGLFFHHQHRPTTRSDYDVAAGCYASECRNRSHNVTATSQSAFFSKFDLHNVSGFCGIFPLTHFVAISNNLKHLSSRPLELI